MTPGRPSPAQIRAQAARAFRRHCQEARLSTARAMPMDDLVMHHLARLAPAPLRPALPGETQLSSAEVRHGYAHGLIDHP